MANTELIPYEPLDEMIHLVRGRRVILDADLARLFDVPTKRLNEQVKRNAERFPDDFMIRLTRAEKTELVANCDHLAKLKFASALPNAFTEHGVIMAANVLNAPKAVEMSVHVVRAFIRLRERLMEFKDLAAKVDAVERKVLEHDTAIRELLAAVRALMTPPNKEPKRRIGFRKE